MVADDGFKDFRISGDQSHLIAKLVAAGVDDPDIGPCGCHRLMVLGQAVANYKTRNSGTVTTKGAKTTKMDFTDLFVDNNRFKGGINPFVLFSLRALRVLRGGLMADAWKSVRK